MRVVLESRRGNIVIATLGVLYAVSASALLIYYVFDTWGAAGMVDRALQAALLIAAGAGTMFFVIGRDNLRDRLSVQRPAPRHRPANAAAGR